MPLRFVQPVFIQENPYKTLCYEELQQCTANRLAALGCALKIMAHILFTDLSTVWAEGSAVHAPAHKLIAKRAQSAYTLCSHVCF